VACFAGGWFGKWVTLTDDVDPNRCHSGQNATADRVFFQGLQEDGEFALVIVVRRNDPLKRDLPLELIGVVNR